MMSYIDDDIADLKTRLQAAEWRIEQLESVNAARGPDACEAASPAYASGEVPMVGDSGEVPIAGHETAKYPDGQVVMKGDVVESLNTEATVLNETSIPGLFCVRNERFGWTSESHNMKLIRRADAPRADPSSFTAWLIETTIAGSPAWYTNTDPCRTFTTNAAKANYEEAKWLLECATKTVEPMATVSGVLSQISNFIAGQRDELQAKDAEIAELRKSLAIVTNDRDEANYCRAALGIELKEVRRG